MAAVKLTKYFIWSFDKRTRQDFEYTTTRTAVVIFYLRPGRPVGQPASQPASLEDHLCDPCGRIQMANLTCRAKLALPIPGGPYERVHVNQVDTTHHHQNDNDDDGCPRNASTVDQRMLQSMQNYLGTDRSVDSNL